MSKYEQIFSLDTFPNPSYDLKKIVHSPGKINNYVYMFSTVNLPNLPFFLPWVNMLIFEQTERKKSYKK